MPHTAPLDVVGAPTEPVGVDGDELRAIVRDEIEDAVDYIEREIGPDRAESTEYYRGEPLGNEEEGRSQVVSRDVRDAVRQVLPSLMRVFFGAERAVEFVPTSQEDVPMAEQATDYVNYVLLQDNPGFDVFHSVFKDSLYNMTGVVKYWLDESVEVEYQEFSGLDDVALGLLLNAEEGVELVELQSVPDQQMAGQAIAMGLEPPMEHSGRVRRVRRDPKIRVQAVPPEEFLIDRNAKSIDDARYVGHRTLMSFTDLVEMGYDPEFLRDHIQNSNYFENSTEVVARYDSRGGQWPHDTMNEGERKILYTESYIRVDVDGDEVSELRKICTVGEGYEIVNGDVDEDGQRVGEPVSERPFAAFCPDPEPHLFFGDDIAEQTKDIQKIRTMVLRSVLDSLAQSVHPRTAMVEGRANLEDVLNTEVGAVIRMDAPGMVQPFTVPFVGKEAMPVLELLENERDRRVGIHNMALEADALQSTTKAAVNAQVDSARQNLELIARIYAESGMKRLFRGLLGLIVKHQDKGRMVRLRNEWVQVDPATWDPSMDVSVNVGLGHGMTEDRLETLREMLAFQREVLTTMGPNNPLVTLGQLSHTVSKIAELNGYKDASQFVNPLPKDFQPPPPPDEPTPEELLAQVEREKTMADMENDRMEADLKRDELLADILLRARELEMKHGAEVDIDAIRNSVDFNRLFTPRGDVPDVDDSE